jgi:hypothetical protein
MASGLTDAEIFVLMACEGVGKSPLLRVFPRRVLRRPSVVKPLKAVGVDVDEVVHSLVEKGHLKQAGRNWLAATPRGNVVKHAFDRLRNDLVLDGKLPPVPRILLERIPQLRVEMERREKLLRP